MNYKEESLSEINKQHNMVWRKDPRPYKYVRGAYGIFNTGSDPEDDSIITIIGFEKVKPGEAGLIYWVKSWDYGQSEDDGAYEKRFPSEAIKII